MAGGIGSFGVELAKQPFGSGGGGFGSDVLVPIVNGSGVSVNAVELISALTGLTGAEVSSFLIKLYRAGSQISALKIDSEAGLTIVVDKLSPAATLTLNASNAGSTSNGLKFQTQGADRVIFSADVSGHAVIQTDGFFDIASLNGVSHFFRVQPNLAMILSSQFNWARTGAVAVATTITLPNTGNMVPLTVGTGTLNSIVAPPLPGFDAILDCAAGITITHNVAGTGVTILTSTGANIVTAGAGRAVRICYNGTNWLAQA